MAAPIGDMVSQLMNPNADANLAAAITPNPNPLAQQGQPPPATSGSPTLPNAAVNKQDPVSANLAYLLLDRQRKARAAEGLEQGLGEISAGFGTAQQQQSKQAQLHGGGGAGGGGIGDVSDIMGIQKAVTDQNEHARFMANMNVLAKVLFPNDPDGVAKATEVANNPNLLSQMGGASASNATQTPTVKDFNTARADLTASMKRDNPNMSDPDIAAAVDKRMPPDLLMSSVGGNADDAAYYQYAALERAAGRTPMDPIAWKNQHAVELKEQDATAMNVANAKKALPGINTTLNNMTGIANGVLSREDLLRGIFADKNKVRWANDIMKADPKSNVALNAQQEGALSPQEVAVIQDAQQLHNMNYRGAFSGEGGVKGIRSQVEADRVSRAADQLGNFNDPDKYIKNLNILKGTYKSAQANSAAEAQAYDQIPEDARYRLDPSYFEGGPNAPKVLPEWAKVKTVNSKSDWDQLPQGQAYKAPGSPHGNKILIKGYEQQSMDDEDNYGG